jgi:cytosine permease
VPATLVIWVGAALIGKYWEWGLPSVNSLVIAFVVYAVAGRLGLVRGVGVTREKDTEEALVDETGEVRRPARDRH